MCASAFLVFFLFNPTQTNHNDNSRVENCVKKLGVERMIIIREENK
jgi:hypothetical protein